MLGSPMDRECGLMEGHLRGRDGPCPRTILDGDRMTAPVKPHLSNTSMGMLWRCGEAYRRRYVEKEIIPPGIAILTGKGFHKGAETNFRQKIQSHSDLPADEIVDAAVAAFEKEVSNAPYQLTEEEASIGKDKVLGEAKDKLAMLAEFHAKKQAFYYQPISVEHETRIVFPDATHDLVAITDLRDDHDTVVDLKTSSRKIPVASVHSNIQLTIYAAAFRIDTGRMPRNVTLEVAVKGKDLARQRLDSTRGVKDFQGLIKRINASINIINSGVFVPCPPDSWWCSPKWCGYFRTCPYVNSERIDRSESEFGDGD